jgi:hypothetical protein
MPSSSKKQHNFMMAIAHSPAFAKKVGVPQSVGSDFTEADKGRKFAQGGTTMAKGKMFGGKETYAEEMKEGRALKSGKISLKDYAKGEMEEGVHKARGGTVQKMPMASKMGSMNMAKGGCAMARGGGIEAKGKTQGKMVKMAAGGKVGPNPTPQDIPDDQPEPPKSKVVPTPAPAASAPKQVNKPPVGQRVPGTNTYDVQPKTDDTKRYAKGGCVKMARGGGIEQRGKTRGRFV